MECWTVCIVGQHDASAWENILDITMAYVSICDMSVPACVLQNKREENQMLEILQTYIK